MPVILCNFVQCGFPESSPGILQEEKHLDEDRSVLLTLFDYGMNNPLACLRAYPEYPWNNEAAEDAYFR